MKLLAIAVLATALVGCTTHSDPSQQAEKALITARAAHESVCSAVIQAHATNILVGENFNKAKAACIKADDLLDSADRLYGLGQVMESMQTANQALNALGDADSLTPKEQKPSGPG